MKNFGFSILILGCVITLGCAERKVAAPAPPPPAESILGYDSNAEHDSLFKGDQSVLSDQDISRILSTQLKLSDRHRMAVLNLNSTTWWSEDLADIEAKNFENLVSTLKSSPQLTDVQLLPSLLVPEKRTVPYLREAAARIQADLLLVYTTRIQSFRRDRFIKADEVHAECIAESVLLDVRTGIVVHTAHATENIAMNKTSGDLNFNETVARAESEAKGKALVSIAKAVVARLAADQK